MLPSRPLFQATFYLWRPTFSSPFPALKTPLPFAFQDQFLPISTKLLAPWTQILAKIVPETPVSSQKISSGALFLKTWAAHTYSNLCPLPPPGIKLKFQISIWNIYVNIWQYQITSCEVLILAMFLKKKNNALIKFNKSELIKAKWSTYGNMIAKV